MAFSTKPVRLIILVVVSAVVAVAAAPHLTRNLFFRQLLFTLTLDQPFDKRANVCSAELATAAEDLFDGRRAVQQLAKSCPFFDNALTTNNRSELMAVTAAFTKIERHDATGAAHELLTIGMPADILLDYRHRFTPETDRETLQTLAAVAIQLPANRIVGDNPFRDIWQAAEDYNAWGLSAEAADLYRYVAANSAPDELIYWMGSGLAAETDEQWLAAAHAYEQGRLAFPDQLFFHRRLAQLYFNINEWESAIDAVERWLVVAPQDPHALFLLANSHERRGEITLAQEALNRYFGSSHLDAPVRRLAAWTLAAEIALQRGDYAQAFKNLDQGSALATELGICYGDGLLVRGQAHVEQGQMSEGQAAGQQAALCPGYQAKAEEFLAAIGE